MIQTLVRTVGIYTHTHWVNKSYNKKHNDSNDSKSITRVRYKCFRDSNGKKKSHTVGTTCHNASTEQLPTTAPMSPVAANQLQSTQLQLPITAPMSPVAASVQPASTSSASPAAAP
eukprot:1240421-Pyramimonas_sp.AAC.1